MNPRTGWSVRFAMAGALVVAATLVAAPARGDSSLRLSVDWGKLETVLREGPAALFPQPRESLLSSSERSERNDMQWFGLSPHVSLVARDWAGAQLLLGHLTLTDLLRLSRSSRMFVTRVRLADGRFAPFAHVGFGQWRVDTDLMPVLPHDVELAAQVGLGFEVTLSRHAALAIEGDHTILLREQREPQMIATPHLWGAFLAARALF
jgi:hypothetical protein